MTSTTITNNFALTHLNQACLIQMPSNFTSVEANSFKQLFQKFCRRDSNLSWWSFLQLRKKGSAITKIILDFGQTTHIDSSGLVGLCQIVQLAKNTKLDLTFYRFSPQVKMVLSLAGLEQIFSLDENADVAISQQTNIDPIAPSVNERLLNVCRLGMMLILFLPIAIADKLSKDNFLPNM